MDDFKDKPTLFDSLVLTARYYFPFLLQLPKTTHEVGMKIYFILFLILGFIFFPIGMLIFANAYLKQEMIPAWEKENAVDVRPDADN